MLCSTSKPPAAIRSQAAAYPASTWAFEPGIAPMFEVREAALVMDRDHRIDGEARVAVPGGEQDDVVSPRHQPVGQRPALGFHAAREGPRHRMAQMGEERDPHAVAAAAAWASRWRMTEAELL